MCSVMMNTLLCGSLCVRVSSLFCFVWVFFLRFCNVLFDVELA